MDKPLYYAFPDGSFVPFNGIKTLEPEDFSDAQMPDLWPTGEFEITLKAHVNTRKRNQILGWRGRAAARPRKRLRMRLIEKRVERISARVVEDVIRLIFDEYLRKEIDIDG